MSGVGTRVPGWKVPQSCILSYVFVHAVASLGIRRNFGSYWKLAN